MSDCYESMSWTPIRDRPLQQPLIGHSGPSIRHSGEGRNPEGWGEGIVARGLVPRWGRGGAWQNPPCRFAVPNHNSRFSYLGVPAPTGMSDWYESTSRTPIRDRPLQQPLIGHSGPSIRHSGDQKHAPYPDTGPESRRVGEGKTTANLWVKTDVRESTTPAAVNSSRNIALTAV